MTRCIVSLDLARAQTVDIIASLRSYYIYAQTITCARPYGKRFVTKLKRTFRRTFECLERTFERFERTFGHFERTFERFERTFGHFERTFECLERTFEFERTFGQYTAALDKHAWVRHCTELGKRRRGGLFCCF